MNDDPQGPNSGDAAEAHTEQVTEHTGMKNLAPEDYERRAVIAELNKLTDLNRNVDINSGLEIIRLLGHAWVIFAGILALTPTLSTETSLLVDAGLPYWTLGVTLLFGGFWLTAARLLNNNWMLFALGDILAGTMCFAMVTVMLIGSINRHASYLSVALWLLPASLFQLHAIFRWRWKDSDGLGQRE